MTDSEHTSNSKFFNPFSQIEIHGTQGLPHWQQPGATYFVTFRLGDSLPKSKLVLWRLERDAWLANHESKPWDSETEETYHKEFSLKIETWLDDGSGSCLLRDQTYRNYVETAVYKFEGERTWMHSFVIMPNHVHALVSLSENVTLEKTIKAWKGVSAHDINKMREAQKGAHASIPPAMGRSIWGRNYFDRMIRDHAHFKRVARYIRNNPEKAGLSDRSFLLKESDAAKKLLERL